MIHPVEGFVFVVALKNSKLLDNTEAFPANRVMAVVKAAEEEWNHMVDRVRHVELVKRLRVTAFIE
jgi:hypothetical protein